MEGSRPLAHSIRKLIGGTPLLDLHRYVDPRGLRGRLLTKLEFFNLGTWGRVMRSSAAL